MKFMIFLAAFVLPLIILTALFGFWGFLFAIIFLGPIAGVVYPNQE